MFAMKRALWSCVVVAVVAVAALAGCTPTPPAVVAPLRIDAASGGKTVQLQVGQRLEIALDANATTGYGWEVKVLPSQVTTVSDEYVAAPGSGNIVGAGGTHTFVFEAAAPGTDVLRLDYVRSFDRDAGPARTFTVTVTVR